MEYYLYFYLNPFKPGRFSYNSVSLLHEPFYVGKGAENRCYAHLREAIRKPANNSHKLNTIRKIIATGGMPIIFILTYGPELKILSLETAFIKEIGRMLDKTGPLTNIKIDNAQGHYCKSPNRMAREIPGPPPSRTMANNSTNEMMQIPLTKIDEMLDNNFKLIKPWAKPLQSNSKSRSGVVNGMHGKSSKAKGKKWVTIDSKSFLLSLTEIDDLSVPFIYGRIVPKNSNKVRKRVILQGKFKSCYMTPADIKQLPYGTKYQIGLLWKEHNKTYTVK